MKMLYNCLSNVEQSEVLFNFSLFKKVIQRMLLRIFLKKNLNIKKCLVIRKCVYTYNAFAMIEGEIL